MTCGPVPLVSVVTPFYNEEQHLATCIESVRNQTYSNWEYTIVDNCSSDSSRQIALKYAAIDSRIHVCVNERFLPMLANHNNALRKISPHSKYCKMVFADDWISPVCLEHMVAVAEPHPTVGIVSAYEQSGEQIRLIGLPREQIVVPGRDACRGFLMDKLLLFGSQNTVMYRADLVRARDPFFVESDMYADFEACFALLRTSDLGFVHEVATFATPRPQSASAIASDAGAHFRSLLGLLYTYGPDILNADEFEAVRERILGQYYRFLGRRIYLERSPAFWSYHRETFAALGLEFSRTRLAKSAARQLIGSIKSPASTWESIWRVSRLRRIRSADMRHIVSGFGADHAERANDLER